MLKFRRIKTKTYLTKFVPTKKVIEKARNYMLQKIKIKHCISIPVLYQEDEKYYLAFFLFFFSIEDIQSKQINRPTLWLLADIKTGDILRKYATKVREFSNASYDCQYCIDTDTFIAEDFIEEYDEKTFLILDSIRKTILQTERFDEFEYQTYLDQILLKIPKEYRRFYLDLSF